MARNSKGSSARRLQSRKGVAAGKKTAKRRIRENSCQCNCDCDKE